MIGNTSEHLALLNHIMTGTCCNGMSGRYCPEGRRLWIDDQAAFIAGLETREEQGYWFREIRAHRPQWAAQIGARVAEMQNVKRAA